eukprot:TRINITY_DN33343_c0_g1_i1.p2 TRINITY_DN33343_c0_g1~~TRINITY_DN33343_c0_g1_i1.p2  ORF type:complete len:156 (+),score=50.69 TRINITY_DN33343_c0_g1_i1:82-549(+)
MEVILETQDADRLPKDCYLSVRIGDSQKLARAAPCKSYKFPPNVGGGKRWGKIEILKRVSVGALLLAGDEPQDGPVTSSLALDVEGEPVIFNVTVPAAKGAAKAPPASNQKIEPVIEEDKVGNKKVAKVGCCQCSSSLQTDDCFRLGNRVPPKQN